MRDCPLSCLNSSVKRLFYHENISLFPSQTKKSAYFFLFLSQIDIAFLTKIIYNHSIRCGILCRLHF